MTYVFFDCECANCLNGEGKICSFGFVKTTKDLEIIKKKDILIDPDAPFLLGNAENGEGIKLAYPLFRFSWAHTFPSYYEEIRRVLKNDEETIAFGFAIKQDVSYLLYTFQRYQLEVISFRFFDVQLLEQRIHNRNNPSSLDHLIQEYKLPEFTYHRSDDDAYMTMEVLKGIMNETGKSIEELIQICPEAMSDVYTYRKELEEKKRQKELKRKTREKINLFYESLNRVSYNVNCYSNYFYQKNIYFEYYLLVENLDSIYQKAKKIKRSGGNFIRNPNFADYIVVKQKTDSLKKLASKPGSILIEYRELIKKIK